LHAPSRPREACGVFGIYNHPEAAALTYFGLYALQHRGQESAGIAVYCDGETQAHKAMGLVPEIFNDQLLAELGGGSAIGHVRYSTTGSSQLVNAQPFAVRHRAKSYAVAHNSNLVNAHELKSELEASGSIFQTTMDTEVFLHLLVKSLKGGLEQAVVNTVCQLNGAFSFVGLTSRGEIIGIKDPNGFRPLCLGKVNGNYVLASESCALDLVHAEFVRELDPGEILIISEAGIKSIRPEIEYPPQSLCIFEYIYFARPDSRVFERNVYLTRKQLGRTLAREWPVDADMVLPVPDSGNYAGLGYAEESGIKLELGIVRNHYVGRSFIQPFQFKRDIAVKVKLNPVRDVIKGKRIVIVEDSIVRGTTSRARIKTLRDAGASEIHMRVSCPPLVSPCFYGIDFPTESELVASHKSVPEITELLGLDSLGYISLDGMLGAMDLPVDRFCTACFTKKYPVPVDMNLQKECCGG